MKIRWGTGDLAIKSILGFAILSLSFVQSVGLAGPQLDRQFALEKIGYLRAWDNVDGLFSDYVNEAYSEYFSRQSRFTVQDLSRVDELFAESSLPYLKIIDDPKLLGKLARVTKTESMVRTKIYKEGPQYRVMIDWLHSPKMTLMAREKFVLQESKSGRRTIGFQDLKNKLKQALERLVKKVPFVGHISGRDGATVTINIGSHEGIELGDELVISSLDEVKVHPLLKEVVDWKFNETGRLIVENIEDEIAFCRVAEEGDGRKISRYQKIVHIHHRPKVKVENQIVRDGNKMKKPEVIQPAKLGWASAGLLLGEIARSNSTSSAAVNAGGLGIGGEAQGHLWLTPRWFVDLGLTFGSAGGSATDATSGTALTGDAGASVFKITSSVGYNFLTRGSVFGAKAWVKLGYQSYNYSYVVNATNRTGPVNFGSLFLGLGGSLPIRDRYGVRLNVDLGVINSISETGFASGTSTTGITEVAFDVGGYYHLQTNLDLRVGLRIDTQTADFSNGAALSQSMIGGLATAVFYF